MSNNPRAAHAHPPLPEAGDEFDERIPRRRMSTRKRVEWFSLCLSVGVIAVLAVSRPLSALWQMERVNRYSEESEAWVYVAGFSEAIDNYFLNYKRLPPSVQELTKAGDHNPYPFIKRIPKDPWGNHDQYHLIDRVTYRIVCCGYDGIQGTQDDITWPPG